MPRDPSLPKPRACRNLFGTTPNSSEVDELLATELRKHEEDDRQKYNFDFKTDNPLEGKYVWDECNAQDIPAFYRPVTVTSGRRSLSQRTPCIASEASDRPVAVQTSTNVDATCNTLPSCSRTDTTDVKTSSSAISKTVRTQSCEKGPKRRQPKITGKFQTLRTLHDLMLLKLFCVLSETLHSYDCSMTHFFVRISLPSFMIIKKYFGDSISYDNVYKIYLAFSF